MSMKTLEARVQYLGGNNLGRMNKQKLQSFKSALKNSYNKRMISTPCKGAWPCLINTDSLQPEYDKKILSVEFNSELQSGDTFEVLGDSTYWMIYLPDLVETAYLKAQILRCRYYIEIDGEKYWIYFKGPVETSAAWQLKENINFNELNLTGTIYIKNNEQTKEHFQRFTTFQMDGDTWQCVATDAISVPGILEISIKEYYNNTIADLPQIIKQDEQTGIQIIGKTIVKQGEIVGYTIPDAGLSDSYSWKITGNNRVKILEVLDNGRVCKVQVYPGAVRTYTVSYGTYTLTASIDVSTSVIKGDTTVYPYETHVYEVVYDDTYDANGNATVVPVGTCTFSISGDSAKIVSTTSTTCTIDITSGKSGDFVLTAKADGQTYTLPITIKSL